MNSRLGPLPNIGSLPRMDRTAAAPISRIMHRAPLPSSEAKPALQIRNQQGKQLSSLYGSQDNKNGRPSMFGTSNLTTLAVSKGIGRHRQGDQMAAQRGPSPLGFTAQSSALNNQVYSNADDYDGDIIIDGPMRPQSMLHHLTTEDHGLASPSVAGLRGLREIRNSPTSLRSAPNPCRGTALKPLPLMSQIEPEKGKKKKKKKKNKSKKNVQYAKMPQDGILDMACSPQHIGPLQFDVRQNLSPINVSPFQKSILKPIGSVSTSLQVASVDRHILANPREALSPNRRASPLQVPVDHIGPSKSFNPRQIKDIFTNAKKKLAPIKSGAFMHTTLKSIGDPIGEEHDSSISPHQGTLAPTCQIKQTTSVVGKTPPRPQANRISKGSPINHVTPNGENRNLIAGQTPQNGKRPIAAVAQAGPSKNTMKRGPVTNPRQSTQQGAIQTYQPPFKMGRRRQTSDFDNSPPEDTDEEEAMQDIMNALARSTRQGNCQWQQSPTSYGTAREDNSPVNQKKNAPVKNAIIKRYSPAESGGGMKAEFVRVIDEGVQEGNLCIDSSHSGNPKSSTNTNKSKKRQIHLDYSSDESSKSFVFESPSTHHSYHTSDEDTDIYKSNSESEEIDGESYLDKLRKKLLKNSEKNQDDKPHSTKLASNAHTQQSATSKEPMYDEMVAAIAKQIYATEKKLENSENDKVQMSGLNVASHSSETSEESFIEEFTSEATTHTHSMTNTPDSQKIVTGTKQHTTSSAYLSQSSTTTAQKTSTVNGTIANKQMAEVTNGIASITSSASQCVPTMLSRVIPLKDNNAALHQTVSGTKQQTVSLAPLPQSSTTTTKTPATNSPFVKNQNAEVTNDKVSTTTSVSMCVPTMLNSDVPLKTTTRAHHEPVLQSTIKEPIAKGQTTNETFSNKPTVTGSYAASTENKGPTASGPSTNGGNRQHVTELISNEPTTNGDIAKGLNSNGSVTKGSTAEGPTTTGHISNKSTNNVPIAKGLIVNAQNTNCQLGSEHSIGPATKESMVNGSIAKVQTDKERFTKGLSVMKHTAKEPIANRPNANGPATINPVGSTHVVNEPLLHVQADKGLTTVKSTVRATTTSVKEADSVPLLKQPKCGGGESSQAPKTEERMNNEINMSKETISISNDKPSILHECISPRLENLSNSQRGETSLTKEVGEKENNIENMEQITRNFEISRQKSEDVIQISMIDEGTQSVQDGSSIKSSDDGDFIKNETSQRSHISSTNSHNISHRSSHSSKTGCSHNISQISHGSPCRSVHSECTINSYCGATCCNQSQQCCCQHTSRFASSCCQNSHSEKHQESCCSRNDSIYDMHRNTSGSALFEDYQQMSPKDSCACSQCNQNHLRTINSRSMIGSKWNDHQSNPSTTFTDQSLQDRQSEYETLLPGHKSNTDQISNSQTGEILYSSRTATQRSTKKTKRQHSHQVLPERKYNRAVNEVREKRMSNDTGHTAKTQDSKEKENQGWLTPDNLSAKWNEIPGENSIDSWVKESTQSMSFVMDSASTTEHSVVSSQECFAISSDQMYVGDEEPHSNEGHENSYKQDQIDIRDSAYPSSDVNDFKSAKDKSMALQFVRLGLIETTVDFEAYKDNLLKTEIKKQEMLFQKAISVKHEMSTPQVIICPCATSHCQPLTSLPPHRCSRCHLMCNEPVTYRDLRGLEKAKQSYTTDVAVEKTVFRTPLFGLTGIPSEDKKVWHHFCRNILSGFGDESEINHLPHHTISSFQANVNSTYAAFKKPGLTDMCGRATTNQHLQYANNNVQQSVAEETVSTVSSTISVDGCSRHIQEIQEGNKKVQELELQLQTLKSQMQVQQLQKECELIKVQSQYQHDKEEFQRKLKQAREDINVMKTSYQLDAEREQEDLNSITLRVSDIEKQRRNDEIEIINMDFERNNLKATVKQQKQQLDSNQIEKDKLEYGARMLREEFQTAQTNGKVKDRAIKKWKLKNEERSDEISKCKNNADKLRNMLEQHKMQLEEATRDTHISETKIKEALQGQSESYAKTAHLEVEVRSLLKDKINETSTRQALEVCVETLRKENKDLISTNDRREQKILELNEDRMNVRDREIKLDRELFDFQDKLKKKSFVVTDLEITKTLLENRVRQLDDLTTSNNIIMGSKTQQLTDGKRTTDELRQKVERLEGHLRLKCQINNNLRDDKVLLGKKLSLLESQLDCAWNEHDANYEMIMRELNSENEGM